MPENKTQQLQRRISDAQKRSSRRTKSVQYQNDSIKVTPWNYQTSAYYEPSTGRIVRNVTSAQKSEDDIRIDVSHEAKHASNAKLGIPDVSAEQFYKLQMLDETSAHIVSVLCWREEYLKAKDKKKFLEEEMNRNLSARRCPIDYVEAIAEGRINPESKDPKEFDKEMTLIARGEFESMSSDYSGYTRQFTSATRGYMNTSGRDFTPDDAEFEKHAKHYMTIAGVDFRKYLEPGCMERVHMPEGIKNSSKSMAGNGNADEGQLIADGGLIYDGKVSLEQYHKLLQHKAIANSILYSHRSPEDRAKLANGSSLDEDVTSSYQLFKKLSTHRNMDGSNSMEQFVDNNMALALNRAEGNVPDNDAEFEKKLREIYTVPGTNVDLRDHISGFNPDDVPLSESEDVKEFLKDPEKYKAEHPYERSYQGVLEYNEGDVKWAENSEDQRVSNVEDMEAFDSEGDFLKAEREKRELEQELERLRKLEEKKKVQPLTTEPKPLMYRVMDGMRVYFKPDPQQQFSSAELKSAVNEDGSRTDAAYLDGQKHGAEITRDKDGNITDIKLYDRGREMNLDGHKLDVRTGTQTVDGKEVKATQVMLDGKPFGATVAEDGDGNIKADFYDNNGKLISGKNGAEISASTEYKAAEENKIETPELSAEAEVKTPENAAVAEVSENTPVSPADTLQVSGAVAEPQTVENYAYEVSDTLQRGHNRIAEMRAKMAAGHPDRLTVGREASPAERRLQELRFDSSHRSRGTITPTRINIQQLGQLLQSVNE